MDHITVFRQKTGVGENAAHGFSLLKGFLLEVPEKGQSTAVGDGTVIDQT